MAEKPRASKEAYRYALTESMEIDVGYTWASGQINGLVVGLYRIRPRPRLMIARFDNAHGFVHLDLLDPKGRLIAKVPFVNVPLRRAIQYAKDYFQENAELLRDQFQSWK